MQGRRKLFPAQLAHLDLLGTLLIMFASSLIRVLRLRNAHVKFGPFAVTFDSSYGQSSPLINPFRDASAAEDSPRPTRLS